MIQDDYTHCRSCDKVINLDKETWYTDGNNTYCEADKPDCQYKDVANQLEN